MMEVAIERRSYRAATEDRAAVFDHAEGRVVVVADGVGGRAGGARAADGLVAFVAARVAGLTGPHRPRVWAELLEAADADLRAGGGAGETTAVVLAVTARGIAGACVGDSEAWAIGADGVPVVLAGRVRRKPYLGQGYAIPVPFAAGPLDGTLLVATDGLFKYADPGRIAAAARLPDLTVAAAALADLPRSGDGRYHDDLAVVVCRSLAFGGPNG